MAGLSSITRQASADDNDRVTVLIDGDEFAYWSKVEINLAMDAFASVSFVAPFDPGNANLRKALRPFSFKPLELRIGGEAIFVGKLVGVHPSADKDTSSVEVTGYALPGVLEDCSIPAKYLPIELKDLDLQQILTAVSSPFGVEASVDGDPGANFATVKYEKDEKALSFIMSLIRQRNMIVNSDAEGKMLCYRPDAPGRAVAELEYGIPPVTSMEAELNPREYFSELTGFAATKKKKLGTSHTVENAWLTDVLRPSNFTLDDTESADVPAAVEARLGRMYANACSFTTNVSTWRDKNGSLWKPGTIANMLAPKLMVYQPYDFLIRSVSLTRDENSKHASLSLILPGSFTGGHPDSLPWDEPGFGA